MISLLNGAIISRGEISTEITKMELFKILVVILCILRLNFAAVRSCLEEDRKNRICFKSMGESNSTYVDPYPLVVNTTIKLKEISEINEKDSSITVRIILVTTWRDPSIVLSNGTTG